jgi:hypothetical protein
VLDARDLARTGRPGDGGRAAVVPDAHCICSLQGRGGRERETEVERRWSWCGMRMAGLRLCTFPCVCPCMCRAGSGRSGRSCEPFFFQSGRGGGAIRPSAHAILFNAGREYEARPGIGVAAWCGARAGGHVGSPAFHARGRSVTASLVFVSFSVVLVPALRFACCTVHVLGGPPHRRGHRPTAHSCVAPPVPNYRMIQYKRGIFICK